jgi:hypothetical protein
MNEGTQVQEIVEEFYQVKEELELFERHRARGTIIRSKIQWTEEGEKNTSYFLRLEKNNYCNKFINKIQVGDKIITESDEILHQEKSFFDNLYSEDELSKENPDITNKYSKEFTEHPDIPKLDENYKAKCENYITESELLKSLKAMKSDKTPGTSGLNTEFYIFFWIDIKDIAIESLNFGLKNGMLSIEQKRGIITLLPKKDKNRFFLKNWRPITLLNLDYKLLAKTLANRMVDFLPILIDDDQTGYIKGRFIGCNIRLIEDMIFYTESNNISGILLTIDFEKAFDSINWRFLDESLKAFNFGPLFRGFIKTLYTDISSTVLNNGKISDWFHPKRGVTQGCPISPYLFILTVELLAISIRGNKDIMGIAINDREIKISQLADDTSCFVTDTESVKHVLEVFRKFRLCSGLKVNVDKTKAKCLGNMKMPSDNLFGLDWSSQDVYSLGVTITGREEDHYLLNFKKRLKNLENQLKSWKGRNLSLKGKITVINTLALPPLIYLASVIHVPDLVIKGVKDLLLNFLWDGKPSKIAYDVIIQQINCGGLKLVDFEEKIKAIKVGWITRLTDSSNGRWKAAPSLFYKTVDLNFYFCCNQSCDPCIKPNFYQDIHNFWSKLQVIKIPNAAIIKNQIIWNNRYITIQKKTVKWDTWIQHGILKINDIIHSSGHFLDHTEISCKFDIKCNFLNILQLRQSLPLEWRSVLQNSTKCNIYNECFMSTHNQVLVPISKCSTKMIYWEYIYGRKRVPTCCIRWAEIYPGLNDNEELWKNIFSLPFETVRDTQLQTFQFKIIHRLITCNRKLFKMKLKDSPLCSYCDQEDSICHFFLFCPKVKDFWHSFFSWWNRLGEIQIPYSGEEFILFGYQQKEDVFNVLNYCILHAKFFIYKQRLFHSNKLDLYEFLVELKFKLQIEHSICKDKLSFIKFEKYTFVYDQL